MYAHVDKHVIVHEILNCINNIVEKNLVAESVRKAGFHDGYNFWIQRYLSTRVDKQR
jgi:hypothetical protein